MLDKSSLQAAHKKVKAIFGPCTWLINGAGGNNPRATTTKETYEPGDETRTDIATFFNLDPKGVEFVFNLNFLGTLLPTQEFATDLLGQEGASIVNGFVHECVYASDENSGLFRGESGRE